VSESVAHTHAYTALTSAAEVHLFPLSRTSEEWHAAEPSTINSDGLLHVQGQLFAKHTLSDVRLSWARPETCIARLPLFGGVEPRRVELSGDSRLLLVLGMQFHDTLSLVVFRIVPQHPFLVPIFHDAALAVIDATFAPDSRSLAVIPAAFNTRFWIVPLFPPDAACPTPPVIDMSPTMPSAPPAAAQVAPFARITGVIAVIGPAIDAFGYMHEPRRIAAYAGVCSFMKPHRGVVGVLDGGAGATATAAGADDDDDGRLVDEQQYHFVTWSDECDGSYTLWSVWTDGESQVPIYRTYPRLLVPTVRNTTWLDEPTTPKIVICLMKFSRTTAELLAVVRRENFRRQQDNGVSLQTIRLDGADGVQVGMSRIVTPVYNPFHVLQAAWTMPLLIGTRPQAFAVVEDYGVFEIAHQSISAQFLDKHDFFHTQVRCFAQIDRYRRLWLDKRDQMHLLFIEPRQLASQALDWPSLFDTSNAESLPLRLVMAKIGYTIKDFRDDQTQSLKHKVETTFVKASKKPALSSDVIPCNPLLQGEAFDCVHLYRCFSCGEVLVRPLVCVCGSAAFCGMVCQAIFDQPAAVEPPTFISRPLATPTPPQSTSSAPSKAKPTPAPASAPAAPAASAAPAGAAAATTTPASATATATAAKSKKKKR